MDDKPIDNDRRMHSEILFSGQALPRCRNIQSPAANATKFLYLNVINLCHL